MPNQSTVTFDDLSSPGRLLDGQYPVGVIDWGVSRWWLSGPWGNFATDSISFPPEGMSEPFSFVSPQRLINIQVFNGGDTPSTVTLACDGNPTVRQEIAANQLLTIPTNWTTTCTTVTVSSSNGWWTNFDNLTYDAGSQARAH